jgi:hypothetical protein
MEKQNSPKIHPYYILHGINMITNLTNKVIRSINTMLSINTLREMTIFILPGALFNLSEKVIKFIRVYLDNKLLTQTTKIIISSKIIRALIKKDTFCILFVPFLIKV